MNSSEKQQLKARAHHLKPVIILGAKGLSDAVTEEANIALQAHELIKIKMKGLEREDKKLITQQLCDALGAELIQMIGNISVLYRKNPE